MGSWSARLPSAVAALLFAAAVAADSPQQQQPTFRTSVEAVVLDVSVLDADGMPIRGLTAEDFAVLEDGTPQKVATFTAVDLPDVERSVPTPFLNVPHDVRSNQAVDEGAIFVLVLDDVATEARSVALGRRYAHEVLGYLRPGDVAAVVFIVNKRAGQEFTRDRSRLAAAVDRWRMGGGGSGALSKLAPRMVSDTLRSVVEGLADVPQKRKAIVYVSTGVPFDFAKGGTPESLGWTTILEAHAAGTDMHYIMDFFDVARRANVNVYCLDPRGLAGPDNDLGREFLQTVSLNTGGFTITQTNDPTPGIVQIYRENASYYILGYTPSNGRRDGRYRKIEVKVNRPGATVRTRKGYIEPGSVKAAAEKPEPVRLETATSSFFPRTDVPMRATAAPFALPRRSNAAVLFVLGIGPLEDDATTHVAGSDEGMEVLLSAYNMLGSLRASERFQAHPSAQSNAGSEGVREVVSRLILRPGQYHLRAAASMGGRTGSVYYDVEVPDFAKAPLTLSGLLLGRGTGTTSLSTADGTRVTLPIAASVQREFVRRDSVTAFVRVYQGGRSALAPVVVSTTIEDERGKTVFTIDTQLEISRFRASREADCRVELPLDRLSAGRYLLTMKAAMGKRTAVRTALFAVATT
jgi:VWFA-related protein